MRVTVDTNIFFSGLIRKGVTRRLWFNPEIELYAPKFILKEFQKYYSYLQEKSRLKEQDFKTLCQKLLDQVSFVEDKELKPYLPAAASLCKDTKDWLYLACALKEDTITWSEDKGFKEQSRIKTLTTKEMIKKFGML